LPRAIFKLAFKVFVFNSVKGTLAGAVDGAAITTIACGLVGGIEEKK